MVRTISFRYKVLRNGAEYGQIYAIDGSAPSIRMDDSTNLKTSLSGDFLEDPYTPVNWLTDEIEPIMTIDGVDYPLGVYLPATVTPTKNEYLKFVRLEAYDRCWRVQDTYTEINVYLQSGENYMTCIKGLLAVCGITIIIETPTDAVLAEAREDWEIGTSYLDIINQLLSEINYNPLWFNSMGAAVLEPVSVPTAENIEHTLDNTDIKSLLVPEIAIETDIYNAPNVFICVCSNPDKSGPMVATSVNNNPQSPISVIRRGRRIVSVQKLNNIASQEELQAYADKLRNQSMIGGETVNVMTGLLPNFGVADVTAIRFDDFSSICVEKAWTMTLAVGGEMSHTLERVVANIG